MKSCFRSLVLLPAVLVVACASAEPELEKVAKDWSMLIRASQVVPVYPLTQDLQPGDIFLVEIPIDQQHEIYREKGFLPLDNHIDRLAPSGYSGFYEASFLTPGQNPTWPRELHRPADASDGAWVAAPSAAFPTYSFTVEQDTGFSLALPISGVPIGLNYLGNRTASGSVSISEAHTIGVATASLYEDLREWAKENQMFLANFASTDDHTSYLRVVSRVYVAGALDVSMRSIRSEDAGVDTGMPLDEDQLDAKLQVTAKSERGISMKETLDPPLVIGYLGFDVVVGENGRIGRPIPTHAVLEQNLAPAAASDLSPVGSIHRQAAEARIIDYLRELPENDEAHSVMVRLDELASEIPGNSVTYYKASGDATADIVESQPSQQDLHESEFGYDNFVSYVSNLDMSAKVLADQLDHDSFKLKRANGTVEQVDEESSLRQQLMEREEELTARAAELGNSAKHQNAKRDAVRVFINLVSYGG